MLLIVVALEVSQPPSGWFNAQLTSIHEKSWTLDTSHLPIGRLNTRAPWNIACMFVTLDTFHALMSPLNAKFLWNILPMLVTLDVSHPLTSIWFPVMCTKSSYMFVTWETSQSGGSVHPAYPHLGLDATVASRGSLAQFASLEHASGLFSRPAWLTAFIAAFRPPGFASLLAGNGAASAAVANALSRRHAAFNLIPMGRLVDAFRPEVAALPTERDGNFRRSPRAVGAGGRRGYRSTECASASVGGRRRGEVAGRGGWVRI